VSTARSRLLAMLPDGHTLPAEQFENRHRTMVRVLWLHAVALPLLAVAYGNTAGHVLVEAVLIAVWPLAAARMPTRRAQAVVAALGLLTCSATLVHITNGLIEAHFHFFVVVTALSLYEDWVVFGLAIGYVLLHHGIGPALGDDVFMHSGDSWGWAGVHAGFILALCVANVAVWRASERARSDLAEAHAELARHTTALERSNTELREFAYAASHDLSEPLRTIASYLQLLERRYGNELDDEADQFIGYAVDGATRMRKLIDDLLAYSRVERTEVVAQPVDLTETVAVVMRSLAPAIEEAGATVEVGPLPTLAADPTQMAQLFQNLVANALKFRHPDRPARVEVRGERVGHGWRLTVADDGIGIEPEQAEKVFGMFQRLHGRDAYEGTGIGLAICRKIVERHGGRISAEPNPGGGTRMTAWIPDRIAPGFVADVAPAPARGRTAPTAPSRQAT
jgi:signal transduction histidine kinase